MDLKQFTYRYIGARIKDFRLSESIEIKTNNDIDFQPSIGFAYDSTNGVVGNSIVIKVVQSGRELAYLKLDNFYELDATTRALIEGAEQYTIPVQALIQFASLSYGTARGVLIAKTDKTPLKDFVLPPTFFSDIYKDDMVFKKRKD